MELQEIKLQILVSLEVASAGTNSTLSGSTAGAIFTLSAGGGAASGTGGGVQGPLRTNTAGTAGAATISGRYCGYFR